MQRPRSLWAFDACYLLAIGCGLASILFGWNEGVAQFRAQLAAEGIAPATRDSLIQAGAVVTGFTYALMILAWTAASFRASRAARWVIVAIALLSLLTLGAQLLQNDPLDGIGVLAILSTVLQLCAVFLLFRPEVQAWFADRRNGPTSPAP